MSDSAVAARIEKFKDLGYGLFLHWGLYSLLEQGEWAKHHLKVPWEEYTPLKERFSAERWDPRSIVRWAKQSGFRYVCLTTRHHDGFSLYDTRGLNDWDAPHSAAKRDLVAEYADACHAEDMAMFFYHTTLDWWHPAFDADWPAYLKYLNDSVEILARNYGKVAGFWFDGNWARKDRDWKEDDLYAVCRRHHPDCIIVNNSSTGARGAIGHPQVDVVTFEQGRPGKLKAAPRPLAAEMCETMNSHWGIAGRDFSYKSPADIINTLCACRRFGANLLLNVGPKADGTLPTYEQTTLGIAGRWIETMAPFIHTARPVEVLTRNPNFVLEHEGSFYYFLHNLAIQNNQHLHTGEPGAGLNTIQGDLPAIGRVSWVDNGQELTFIQDRAQGFLAFNATNFPYGQQLIVRVAKLEPAS